MTVHEFIEGYCTRSGIPEAARPYGMEIEGHRSVALPCSCGEDDCDGWQMQSARGLTVAWVAFQEKVPAVNLPTFVQDDPEFQKYYAHWTGRAA